MESSGEGGRCETGKDLASEGGECSGGLDASLSLSPGVAQRPHLMLPSMLGLPSPDPMGLGAPLPRRACHSPRTARPPQMRTGASRGSALLYSERCTGRLALRQCLPRHGAHARGAGEMRPRWPTCSPGSGVASTRG